MRRLPAIVLLLVVAFNHWGYRLVIDCLQTGSDAVFQQRLDRHDYCEGELLTIKTPLSLPYVTGSPEFERIDGSISINGIEYEYVKRRVFRDTLELLCLPNHDKAKWQTLRNEATRQAVGNNAAEPVKKTGNVKIGLPDYCQSIANAQETVPIIVDQNFTDTYPAFLLAGHFFARKKPPRRALPDVSITFILI